MKSGKLFFLLVAFFLLFFSHPFINLTFSQTTIRQTEEAPVFIQQGTQSAGEIRSQIKQQKQELIEERQNLQEQIRQRRQEAIEEYKTRREEFRQQLTQIKDETKRKVVERINNKLVEVNKRATDHMARFLERLSSILDQIKQKTAEAKAAGTDTTAVEVAIAEAEAAVAFANSAVLAQAGQEYIIEITDEGHLRSAVGKTVSQLRSDIRETRKTVIEAKQAVMKAARELAKVLPVVTVQP